MYLLFLLCSMVAPWNLEDGQREVLKEQIETNYVKKIRDSYKGKLNFENQECPYCQNPDGKSVFEEKMEELGFRKVEQRSEIAGHCHGITTLFCRLCLTHPSQLSESCERIYSEIASVPTLKQIVHELSMNQPAFFEEISDHCLVPLSLSGMKRYLAYHCKKEPSQYYVFPSENRPVMDEVTIFQTLRNLPNRLIFFTYQQKSGVGHSIAIYTDPEKPLLFDSAWGLVRYLNLETLSRDFCQVDPESKPVWIAVFDVE